MTWEIIYCPICGKAIHEHDSTPTFSRGTVSSRDYRGGAGMLTAMMLDAEAEHQRKIAEAEHACITHFQTRHRFRTKIARRFNGRWFADWLMRKRWPWTKPAALEEFNVSVKK